MRSTDGFVFAAAQRRASRFPLECRSSFGSTAMPRTILDPDMPVDEIMRRWPATIRVFMRHRMLCIGCPIGVFHTVTDACIAHELDQHAFETELLAAMRGDPAANQPSAFGEIEDANEDEDAAHHHSRRGA
jgi:hybrid cluster-associated redox disulfide protein